MAGDRKECKIDDEVQEVVRRTRDRLDENLMHLKVRSLGKKCGKHAQSVPEPRKHTSECLTVSHSLLKVFHSGRDKLLKGKRAAIYHACLRAPRKSGHDAERPD